MLHENVANTLFLDFSTLKLQRSVYMLFESYELSNMLFDKI